MLNTIKKLLTAHITNLKRKFQILQTRDMPTPQTRDIAPTLLTKQSHEKTKNHYVISLNKNTREIMPDTKISITKEQKTNYLLFRLKRSLVQSRQSQKNHNQKQYAHRNIKKKNISGIHNSILLANKTLDNQKSPVAITPHNIIGHLSTSSPGITNGKTIEPADNWPAATPTSIKTLTWDSVKSEGLSNKINNNLAIQTNTIKYSIQNQNHQKTAQKADLEFPPATFDVDVDMVFVGAHPCDRPSHTNLIQNKFENSNKPAPHPYLIKNLLSGSGNQIPDNKTANHCQQNNNSLKNNNNIHNHLLSFFRPPAKINNQSAKQSNNSANSQKKISGNNPVLLSNSHPVSSNKSNAILTHQTAKNEDNITVNNLTPKGTVTANPNPPNTNPLARSKKKSANPFDCPRFKNISINQTLPKDKKLVNTTWPAMSNVEWPATPLYLFQQKMKNPINFLIGLHNNYKFG